jgi:hypothetical protein
MIENVIKIAQNLLISTDGTLRISDFGCAIRFDNEANPSGIISETVGSAAFWGPESISNEGIAAMFVLKQQLLSL